MVSGGAMIKVKISPVLRALANCQETVEMSADSPLDCLAKLEAQFPRLREWLYDKQGQFLPQVQLFVNGDRAYPEEWSNHLKDGDELFIMLAIGGG
ncbi:MAG: hypothetical protein DRI39_03480 [Chloroflexi bacterium]|nr:MAG: hypothetical protein DRI40_09210 [Chloroflexota bacterium]RLC94238.1 MAG: hypothetical protein DRI39_03480 [Chloroflexota bacterium]